MASGEVTPEMVFAGWGALKGRTLIGGFEPAVVNRHDTGTRVDLGGEVDHLVLKYGEPGVLSAPNDVRGPALQEVRCFDFSDWPNVMGDADRRKMKSIVHSPQWCLISANGMRACKPITGAWYWKRDNTAEYERLSKMTVVGYAQ